MIAPNRVRSLCLFLIALIVVMVLAIPLTSLLRSRFERQAAVSRKQAAVEAIRQRGGVVLCKSDLPPHVIGVDLSSAIVDAELMQALGQFTEIERLSLDGAKLNPKDYELLSKLPRLRSLSFARTNVTDPHISRLPLGLMVLSLNGTSITDKSMPSLAAMNGLASLDIAGTEVTPDGLRQLVPLRSLKTLWIDEPCITAKSAESLRLMRLQSVDVAVLEGLGRRTHECLSVCEAPDIRGYHRDGYLLWAANSAWSHTLAGVVEAVVSEIGLDPQQAAQLLEVLGNQMEDWGPIMPSPLPSARTFEHSTNLPDRGIEIASADEFVRELQKDNHHVDTFAVRRFAREEFTADDVPKLLAAIRAAPYSESLIQYLFRYGPFLLVLHGIDDPEVVAELDRLLAHKNSFVRATTICAFGYGGAFPFYSREEWTASKATDAFAVPRLLRICQDEGEFDQISYDAWSVLAEIAHRRPEYAAEVIPALLDLLDEEGSWHYAKSSDIWRVHLSRLAEVDADAAVAVVPRLRAMLKQLDQQLAVAPLASPEDSQSPYQSLRRRQTSVLQALSTIARASPALAHEIAMEYLGRMRDQQSTGPFAPLLSPDTPEVNRRVVIELLRDTNVAKGELALVAKRIRDWRMAKEPADD